MIEGYADHAAINGRPPPGYARVAVIAFGFVIETFGLFLLTLVYAT